MGISADKCRDKCNNVCPITAEDVHRVVLEAYDILTDCKLCFDEKKHKLYCLEKGYRCQIDTNYPYTFKYYQDCYGFEYFIFIGTVKGGFAIDLVAYSDIDQWTVLNTGSCVRTTNHGACSKTQYSVSKRKDLVGLIKDKYEAKAREIERIRVNGDFCYGKHLVLDWRCKPTCEILEPCHNAKCDEKLAILVKIDNWNMSVDGKHAKLFIDNCEVAKIHNCSIVYVDLSNYKKGWHKVQLRLYDECCKFIGLGCEKKICLRKPKCEKKKKCGSCHKEEDRCGCKKPKCKKNACEKKKKWCDSSSSSSSSSSSECCDSSSSCSSESSISYNFEPSYCCDSSSSSSCSSSSSSSSCSSSSSSSCCPSSSSSSSSCPSSSSSSDYVLKCKKVVKKCDSGKKKHNYYH
ncbi:hypothetical protein D3C87_992760 [compost metagenome]